MGPSWRDCLPPYSGAAALAAERAGATEAARRLVVRALEAGDPAERRRMAREAVVLCPGFAAVLRHLEKDADAEEAGLDEGGRARPEAEATHAPGLLGPIAAVEPDWGREIGRVSPRHFGHNTVWVRDGLGVWDSSRTPPGPVEAVVRLIEDLKPGVLRFPGGTRAMRYHFAGAIGPPAGRAPQCDTFTGMTDPAG